MAGVTASIDLHIKAKQTGTVGLATPQVLIDLAKSMDFSAGTAAVGQANVMYSATRTLAASTGEDLDLAGVLADALGATIAAAEIVAIYIAAAQGNTNDVQLTRPASNGVPLFLAAGDGLSVGPGDFVLLTNRKGIAVTAATGDLLHVANAAAGTSVSYDVVILGRTVAA
jgi:hypothetical protein